LTEYGLPFLCSLVKALYDPTVIRIAVDLKLVDKALAHGSSITANELATQSKADVELIRTVPNSPHSHDTPNDF
jgi:hypothetical protein